MLYCSMIRRWSTFASLQRWRMHSASFDQILAKDDSTVVFAIMSAVQERHGAPFAGSENG